ncbi:UDP-glucosyltransferase 2-like [Maniola hyperantus]|uniref:UDP-glucosyltransferase 2-like n=1 Tax=Aphantopus hyperantus TaxID=2795564 RepID=UPI00156A2A8A|nr:UDP-glucuronosyltransferase 2B19-like [Maniola hyperantus]
MCTKNKIKLFITLYFYLISFVKSAKILAVIPTPSISHQVVFRPLTQELARRGHDVTVITTDPAFPKGQTPKNLTEIDVHDLSYKIWSDVLKTTTGGENDVCFQFETIMRAMSKVFEGQVYTEEVLNIIHKRKGQFDLLLLEAYSKPILVFTHIYKVPVIQMSSLGGLQHNYEIVGASTHPLLYPTLAQQRIYNLTNYEKLQQLYNRWRTERSFDIIEEDYDELLRKIFGQDVPPIRDLYNNVHMLFLNVHPIWTDNQPVPTSVVHIGGIHNHSPQKLPKDLESLLNSSRHGVIYFSLGTNVIASTALPTNKIQMMKNVFSQLPYDVIWKWDLDTMLNKTDNIKLFKWLPQSDLLRHSKVRAFITQGGLQSTDEAIDAGVPLIGIPMFADQWFNTEKYPRHKIGVKLDLATLTEEQFKEAIENVISDQSYRENIKRLRSIMRDEPQSPLERAVWWTEYVLRHGGAKHLRAAGANISWAQYFELELVVLIILVLVATLILFVLSLYCVCKIISRNSSKTKTS